ncbi:MAG: hypothetical protein NT027_19725 [Proteobacteria bacterium]|nr:hypothetical protein [Pseudomonadota bacterium]
MSQVLNAQSLSDFVGVWLTSDYLKELSETRSPMHAAKIGIISGIEIKRSDSTRNYFENFHFHEGAAGTIDRFEASQIGFKLHFKAPTDISESRDFFYDPKSSPINKITMDYKSSKVLLERVSTNSETYVISKVLEGRYRDESGAKYEFSKNGKARFPGKEFKFKINLDGSETEQDYIFKMKGPRRIPIYGFRWEGEALLLLSCKSEPPFVERNSTTLKRLLRLK